MKITEIKNITTKTGKNYKKVKLDDDVEGSFWEDIELTVGQEVDWDIVQKGNFTNFYPKRITPQQFKRDEATKQSPDNKDHVAIRLLQEDVKELRGWVKEIAQKLGMDKPETGSVEELRNELDEVNPDDIPF